MLEADLGTSRDMELDYPEVHVDDVDLVPLKGKFEVIRSSKGLYISGELFSTVQAECARCLDAISLPISIRLDDLFYYPANTAPPGDFGVGEDGFIDLNPLVRQLSLLEIPKSRTFPDLSSVAAASFSVRSIFCGLSPSLHPATKIISSVAERITISLFLCALFIISM